MATPAHIALVGCGFAGTSAFTQLVERADVRQITIFEASGDFGPGYPYRSDECADYLINNTTDTMCLVPSDRRAFVGWLAERPDLVPDLDERGHLPRSLFGAFLKDAFDTARANAARKDIRVRLVPHEVTAMTEDNRGRVGIRWCGGETVADAALLTTGRCPDRDDYEHPPADSPARYFPTHVMTPDLDSVPEDATVHVLGASLSAYDVVNRLYSEASGCSFVRRSDGYLAFEPGPNRRTVVLCSRSGRLKAMQSRAPHGVERRHFLPVPLRAAAAADGGLSLGAVADAVRREAAGHAAAIDWDAVRTPYAGCASVDEVSARAAALMRGAIDAATAGDGGNFLVDFFEDAQIDIWDLFAERLLAAPEERRYRRHFETALLCYAAPCPVPTAEKLVALHDAGRLRVVSGVRGVRLAGDGRSYRIEHPFGVETATVLVNATGAVDRDVASNRQSELVRDLASQGLLQAYRRDGAALGGAAVDTATFRAHGARSIYVANMLLWGPGFFTSSAFMMATVVERILDGLFGSAPEPRAAVEPASVR